jgi:hypothetical protein
LFVVLFGCGTWSLTLREEYRLRISVNGILRNVFEPKWRGTGDWKKRHNEDLHDLYSETHIPVITSRRMTWLWHVEYKVEGRVVFRVLVGKAEGNVPPGRCRHKWEGTTKMDLQE